MVAATDVSSRTINKYRIMVRSIFNYGIAQTSAHLNASGEKVDGGSGVDYGLKVNPAKNATAYTEAKTGILAYYQPGDIEALAEALEQGYHHRAQEHHQRRCSKSATGECDCSPTYRVGSRMFKDRRRAETYLRKHRSAPQRQMDGQDADAVWLSAYAGRRLGELLALRWSDIEREGSALTIGRSLSAGAETTTKSGSFRRVPLPDQAAQALERLAKRKDFTATDQLVICNRVTGRHLDGSALRRRYKLAQAAAGVAPLR